MKKINIILEHKFDILNLSGDWVKRNDIYKFSLFNSDTRAPSKEIYNIVDPSNDQAFKILFNGNYNLNDVNGPQRAISIIQSLLYKFPNNKVIKSIEYWPNEIPIASGQNKAKIKVMDCPLLCKMNDESEYIIDLEMQNYYYDGLDLNALSIGNSPRNASNFPLIILLLLFKESEYNNSFENLNESKFKKIDDNVYVICFDLYYILDCIDNNIEPELNRFEISKKGKEWIRLLTIKKWMKKNFKNKRYPIPKYLNNSPEIISAIMILDSINNSELINNVLKEKEDNSIAKDTEYKFTIKYWINAFLKNELLDQSIIPFPIVIPEYLILQCKLYLDKNKCLLFLQFLIKNKIIKPKKIYNELLDSIYD